MPAVKRASSALLIVVGLIMLCSALSAMAQGESPMQAGFSVNTRDVIYALLGVVIGLIGVWSRIQDKRIAEANSTAAKALEKAHAIELKVVELKARMKVD